MKENEIDIPEDDFAEEVKGVSQSQALPPSEPVAQEIKSDIPLDGSPEIKVPQTESDGEEEKFEIQMAEPEEKPKGDPSEVQM